MSIIAAIDLSPVSINAARSAAQLARRLREKLVLVRATEPASFLYPELSLAGMADLDASVHQASVEALESIALSLRDEDDGEIEVRVQVGRPHEVLINIARTENARLIVLGTNGRGAAGRFFLGSVAQRTLREAECPVLVMRENASPFEAWLTGRRPLRVVVGVDRGPATIAALGWVKRLRELGPCDVTLIHEYWPPAEYARLGLRGPRDIGKTDPEVAGILARELSLELKELGDAAGSPVQMQASWGPVGGELAFEARNRQADLLLVGTRQPHGWNRVATGSIALEALHDCSVPLLAVPARTLPVIAVPEVPIKHLRSVLVATDFSPLGNAAIAHAFGLVAHAGGRVELCHVRERALPSPSYLFDPMTEAGAAERRAQERELAALIPAEAAQRGITCNVSVIDGGAAAEQLLQASRRLGVDAVVLASRGRGGVGRAMLGSVAEAVVRGSDRPVYVVRTVDS